MAGALAMSLALSGGAFTTSVANATEEVETPAAAQATEPADTTGDDSRAADATEEDDAPPAETQPVEEETAEGAPKLGAPEDPAPELLAPSALADGPSVDGPLASPELSIAIRKPHREALHDSGEPHHLRDRGIKAVIPEPDDQKGHRKRRGSRGGRPVGLDAADPRNRNVIERQYGRIKQWRGIATRYDKHAIVYRAAVVLNAVIAWAKTLSDTL